MPSANNNSHIQWLSTVILICLLLASRSFGSLHKPSSPNQTGKLEFQQTLQTFPRIFAYRDLPVMPQVLQKVVESVALPQPAGSSFLVITQPVFTGSSDLQALHEHLKSLRQISQLEVERASLKKELRARDDKMGYNGAGREPFEDDQVIKRFVQVIHEIKTNEYAADRASQRLAQLFSFERAEYFVAASKLELSEFSKEALKNGHILRDVRVLDPGTTLPEFVLPSYFAIHHLDPQSVDLEQLIRMINAMSPHQSCQSVLGNLKELVSKLRKFREEGNP